MQPSPLVERSTDQRTKFVTARNSKYLLEHRAHMIRSRLEAGVPVRGILWEIVAQAGKGDIEAIAHLVGVLADLSELRMYFSSAKFGAYPKKVRDLPPFDQRQTRRGQ